MKPTMRRLDLVPPGLLPQSLRGVDLQPDDWYALDEPGASSHPELDKLLEEASAIRPDVDVFYGDEIALNHARPREARALLKSSFDLTHLIAQDYIGWMLLARGRRLIAYCDSARDTELSTYGLLLHCTRYNACVERIPQSLSVRPTQRTRLPAQARRRLLEDWAREMAPDCVFIDGLAPDSLRIQRVLNDPPRVTLVIPTCQAICSRGDSPHRGRPHILNLLERLGEVDWPMDRLSVIVGDDVEDGTPYLRAWPFEMRRIDTHRVADVPFNYAAKMNELWRAARSEYLVMIDDDIIPRRRDWLRALMTFAMDPQVGGVGARLLYSDGKIQHAGITASIMGTETHVFVGQEASLTTYCGLGDVHREWSMVTGTIFATRKMLLERVNGYDERFPVEFNDLDLCLRMRQLGLRIVYTPFAELVHFGCSSHPRRVSPLESANFLERWQEFLAGDSASHPYIVNSARLVQEERLDAWQSLMACALSNYRSC